MTSPGDHRGAGSSHSDSAAPRNLQRSRQYHDDAAKVIPGGVNSNVRLAGSRLGFTRAHGSRLFDLDGNEYIDYALGMGPAILGHAPETVIAAVSNTLSLGQLFGGQHPSELDLARRIQRHIPSAERVRIGLTGSEMIQAALRAARAYSGRRGFVKFEGHYHGWFDNVLVNHTSPAADPRGPIPYRVALQSSGQSPACTDETYVLPWNDLDALSRFLSENEAKIAAILTEPVMCNTGTIPPRPGYLQGLRELCDRHGVVLIMDEVITGFRLGMGGAQGRFGVLPDLSVFAKALGAGFPVAALVGRADIMELFGTGAVNHSGTYNANLMSVAAANAALELLAADEGALCRQIEKTGEELMRGIRQIAERYHSNLQVTGYGAVFHTHFSDEEVFDYASYARVDAGRQKALLDALLARGVRPTSRGTWFVSAAHTDDDVERTLAAVDVALRSGI